MSILELKNNIICIFKWWDDWLFMFSYALYPYLPFQ